MYSFESFHCDRNVAIKKLESGATIVIKLYKTTPAVLIFVSYRIYWNQFSTLDTMCSKQLSSYGGEEPRLYWFVSKKKKKRDRCVK